MCVLLITRLLRLVGRFRVRTPVYNHTSGVAGFTPTTRSKSVRNCFVIEVFGGGFCVLMLISGFVSG